MTNAEIIALSERYLFPVYARAPLALVRGAGLPRLGRRRQASISTSSPSTVVTASATPTRR